VKLDSNQAAAWEVGDARPGGRPTIALRVQRRVNWEVQKRPGRTPEILTRIAQRSRHSCRIVTDSSNPSVQRLNVTGTGQ
jgi:hypothetical protein